MTIVARTVGVLFYRQTVGDDCSQDSRSAFVQGNCRLSFSLMDSSIEYFSEANGCLLVDRGQTGVEIASLPSFLCSAELKQKYQS